MKFAFDPSRPAGSRIVAGSVSVSGTPVDLGRRYKGGCGKGGPPRYFHCKYAIASLPPPP